MDDDWDWHGAQSGLQGQSQCGPEKNAIAIKSCYRWIDGRMDRWPNRLSVETRASDKESCAFIFAVFGIVDNQFD